MSCQETESLIHGYLDDELDLARSLAIEEHLAACAACARHYQELVTLRSAIRAAAPYYRAPAALRSRFEGTSRFSARAPAWLAAAAALAVVSVAVWKMPGRGFEQVEQEALADHVRSLLPNHLTDVSSSDQHTVKPWFNGKVDFSPAVRDFAAQGFRLVGGRLDYLGGRTVAALVYQRRQHVINVFTWPDGGGDRGVRTDSRHGYNMASFARGGMSYRVVSDLNPAELRELVSLLEK